MSGIPTRSGGHPTIRVGVDGNAANAHLVYTKRAEVDRLDWPFDDPMDIILNIAIGGTWAAPSRRVTLSTRCWSTTSGCMTATGPRYLTWCAWLTAAAEGVVALISDAYDAEENTVWKVEGASSVGPNGANSEGYAYTGLHYVAIEPAAPFDLDAVDTFHVRLYRTDQGANFEISLVEYGASGVSDNTEVVSTVSYLAGTSDVLPADQWIDLAIPVSSFAGLSRRERRSDQDPQRDRGTGVR